MPPATRLVTPDDAPALSELLRRNRDFLAPWEPLHGDERYTVEGQETAIQQILARHEDGTALPHVILDAAGEVAGEISLTNIIRGAVLSARLGYWVAADRNGQGLASAAVRHLTQIAFRELRLHRIEAATLEHNAASQRVLERTGFVRFGLAPSSVRIAGRWQDHVLFQLLNEDDEETGAEGMPAGPGA